MSNLLRLFLCLVFGVLLATLAGIPRAAAQDLPVLELREARTDWVSITPTLSFLRDPTRNLSLERARAFEFTPLDNDTADFGYTRDVIWMRFEVKNATDAQNFVLAMRENFLQLYEVWIIPEGGAPVQLDKQNQTTVFRSRSILYPELSTAMVLEPGAKAEIVIRFWSGGSSELAWRVFTRAAFDEYGAGRTARNFIYYGMAILLAAAAAVAWIVTRRMVFAAYSYYAASALLYVMHADGTTFQYLWPNLPGFNAFASVPLGVMIITGGLVFARAFLSTPRYHPRLDKVLVSMLAFTVLLGMSTVIVDAQPVKRLLILCALVSTAMLAISGVVAARTRFREVRFYLLAWIGAVVSSGIMTMRHWFGIEISEDLQYDSIRLVLIFDGVFMGLAILDRFNWLKQSQRDALEVSLAQARKTVSLNARMQDLEHQVGIAEKLAASQERNIAQTAHDLRQPLTALRLNLRSIMGEEKDPRMLADVEDTLGYLETLVAEQLSTALSSEKPVAVPVPERSDMGPVLQSVVDMFEADAAEKGLRLISVPTTAAAPVPPLVLMRMVSNLVSNAVASTTQGGVVVGVRHAGGLRVEVHDTGPGLPEAVFRQAFDAQGPAPSGTGGTGLGLQIVAQLAAEHGVRFERALGPGGGTVLRLWMP